MYVLATQSCVYREYSRGLPTLTTCGLAVRKSRIQVHRGCSVPTQSSQSGRNYGVESRTNVNNQHLQIAPLPIVKMREGADVVLDQPLKHFMTTEVIQA